MINKSDRKIIEKAIQKILGDTGFYIVTNDGEILYTIDGDKLKQKNKEESLNKITLPALDEIKLVIKTIDPKFNIKKLQSIEYVLEKTTFNKKVVINTTEDLIIYECRFRNGLTIEKAKHVKFVENYHFNNHFRNEIECIKKLEVNAQKLYLNRCQLMMHSGYSKESYVNFNVDTLVMNEVELYSTRNVYMKAKSFEITNSNLFAPIITFNADKINENHNRFSAVDLISINDKNCDLIYNVNASKVLYNGIDITNSEEMKLPQSRHDLIVSLKRLRSKCNESIKKDAIAYQERLKREPLVKRIKKS